MMSALQGRVITGRSELNADLIARRVPVDQKVAAGTIVGQPLEPRLAPTPRILVFSELERDAHAATIPPPAGAKKGSRSRRVAGCSGA